MNDPEVRRYILAADQHLDSARVLLDNQRCRHSVYLAGIGVECGLKSLLLSHVPASRSTRGSRKTKRRAFVEERFRGRAGHDYDRILEDWRRLGGVVPTTWQRHLRRLRSWSIDMRYQTDRIRISDAESFFESADHIVAAIKERVR